MQRSRERDGGEMRSGRGMAWTAVVVAATVAFSAVACGESPSTLETASPEPLTGTTCEELALEVGDQLDAKMLEIADSSPDANGESRSVRSGSWRVVIFDNLNHRLRELGIRDECHAEKVLDLAETRFSDDLVARAGDYLYDSDGKTWTYEEWREEVLRELSVIDGD